MAGQLLVDLYGCDSGIIDNPTSIRQIAHRMIQEIHSEIVEECFHKFEPIGVTYIAVITTSHFSVHTWPEYQYAAVDVFSCDEKLPEIVVEKLKDAFKAERVVAHRIERNIKRGLGSEFCSRR